MFGLQKWGGVAALYMAAAYALTMAVFLVLLDYPHMTDAAQRVALLADKQLVIYVTNLLSYVIFGIALIVFALALHERTKTGAPVMTRVAVAIGIIWAGSLIASGMVANAGIGLAVGLHASDPAQAATTWALVEAVASGLGNGNGEILGGLMTLSISWAGLRGDGLPRLLNYLGIVVGLIGVASTVPGLTDLVGAFGLAQMVWFAWLAVIMLGAEPQSGQRGGAGA